MNASRLFLLTMVLSPAILPAQKKEDILSMQRDIATMDEHVKQMQKSLDEKMAALTALVQQSIDLSNKTSAAMASMQHNVEQRMTEQGTKLVAPVATLGTKVDEMSGDVRSVQAAVAGLVRQMNDMDAKIADMSSAIRTLSATQISPPPPKEASVGGTAQQAPDTPPPGMSAELSYTAALGDYNGKKDDIALEEFAQYVRYYPQSANAPNAQFYMGQIYYRGEDWVNAAKAFDLVLEKFPKNAKTADAQFYKAMSLMKNHQKTDAGKEFKNFLAAFPDNARAKEAHLHLRELGLESSTTRRKD
jgi:TolA-binding protein